MIVTMVQSMHTLEILHQEVGATEHIIQERPAVHHYITGKLIHNHYHSNVQTARTVMLLGHIPMMFIDAITDIQFQL
jgi:hypothetical protein